MANMPKEECTVSTFEKQIARFTLSLAITLLLTASLSAQNVVAQWNAIASTAIVTNGKAAPGASGVWFAYVHLAVFDAVNAIDIAFNPTSLPPIRQPVQIRTLRLLQLPIGYW